ncbi:unnamed protein product [Trichogramma brassicae]|uniref:Uncharacterized protein n=1 Tax=Trichogramma brassicae TaxID=86971 RepID=A0A6H5IV18_9HYME|nr:unnamed protein product [Trichogramma brassicae]
MIPCSYSATVLVSTAYLDFIFVCIWWQRVSSVRAGDSRGAPSPLRAKRRHRRSGPSPLRLRPTDEALESSVLRDPGDEVVHPCGLGPRVRGSVSIELVYYSAFRADPRTTTQLACPPSVIVSVRASARRVLQVQCCSDPESPRSVPVGVPSVRRAVSTTARSFVPFPLYLASRTLVGDEHPLVWRVVHRQSRPGRGEIDTGGVHGEATVTQIKLIYQNVYRKCVTNSCRNSSCTSTTRSVVEHWMDNFTESSNFRPGQNYKLSYETDLIISKEEQPANSSAAPCADVMRGADAQWSRTAARWRRCSVAFELPSRTDVSSHTCSAETPSQ